MNQYRAFLILTIIYHWEFFNSPHVADLVTALEAFDVFPNLFHHNESTVSKQLLLILNAGISLLSSMNEANGSNALKKRERS